MMIVPFEYIIESCNGIIIILTLINIGILILIGLFIVTWSSSSSCYNLVWQKRWFQFPSKDDDVSRFGNQEEERTDKGRQGRQQRRGGGGRGRRGERRKHSKKQNEEEKKKNGKKNEVLSAAGFLNSWYKVRTAVLSMWQCVQSHDEHHDENPLKMCKNGEMMDMKEYYDGVLVVGLDCEMVGGGRHGSLSLLARCSVVSLNDGACFGRRHRQEGPQQQEQQQKEEEEGRRKPPGLDRNLVVLYDKYVVPRRRVTDYRTQYSGITKEMLFGPSAGDIPRVSFDQCRQEILHLFSSKQVLVVGHSLQNDFDALQITHPFTRDTAAYPPYMRPGRTKLLPKKLSQLTHELLDIQIQLPPSSDDKSSMHNYSTIGHSSVEDAAASLRLYWHDHLRWERFLGYPLQQHRRTTFDMTGTKHALCPNYPPLTMFLDGCNLPLGMRGVDFKSLLRTGCDAHNGGDNQSHSEPIDAANARTVIPAESFQLVSKIKQPELKYSSPRHFHHHGTHQESSPIAVKDWIPRFKSALSNDAIPQIKQITILFDGAKFRDIHKYNRNHGIITHNHNHANKIYPDGNDIQPPPKTTTTTMTQIFPVISEEKSLKNDGKLFVEITKDGVSADDVLVQKCLHENKKDKIDNDTVNDKQQQKNNNFSLTSLSMSYTTKPKGKIITIQQTMDILSTNLPNKKFNNQNNSHHPPPTHQTINPYFIILRRKSGGTKTHKRLFQTLNLRRPNEGAYCLSTLTPSLHQHSYSIACQLFQQGRNKRQHNHQNNENNDVHCNAMDKVLEFELYKQMDLKYVVVTNDIYLTERLVNHNEQNEHNVLVLNYYQLQHL